MKTLKISAIAIAILLNAAILPPLAGQSIVGPVVNPAALGAASATSINVTSATAPFQYNGNTVAWFPLDGSSEYQTFFGYRAAYNAVPGGITSYLATCIGTRTCGGFGAGMTGVENTMVGWNAGAALTTGAYNTALGVNSLGAQSTGDNNVAVGMDAMRDITGVSNSVAIGAHAMRNNAGSGNVAIGYQSMWVGSGTTSLGTAANSVAIGYNTMSSASLTTANNDVAIGYNSGSAITTGSNNTYVGYQAGQSNSIGGASVYVGGLAGQSATGSNNTAIGYASFGGASNSAVQDVCIGRDSCLAKNAGYDDVVIGYTAGKLLTTPNQNTIIGSKAASTTLTTGNSNILIGYNVDTPTSSTSSYLNVGNILTGDMTNIGSVPTLSLDASTASSATGLKIKSAAAGAGIAVSAISSGTDENLAIDAKGAGTITLGGVSTGNIVLNRTASAGTLRVTTTGVNGFSVGPNATSNPGFNVDASTASSVTGINVKSAAAGGGVALAAISSGANENVTFDAKGSGTVTINGTGTGSVLVPRTLQASNLRAQTTNTNAMTVSSSGTTNPAFNVDNSTASAATGFGIKANVAGSGVAVSALSSGTNENLTIDAKGTGAIVLNGTGGGPVTIGAGNLVMGTAAKGIDYSINTASAGMTSQILSAYEEGTCTPTDASGASLTFTVVYCHYTRTGRQITVGYQVVYPSTASGATNLISLNLPAAKATGGYSIFGAVCVFSSYTGSISSAAMVSGTSNMQFQNVLGGAYTNTTITGAIFRGTFSYFI